MFYRLFVGRCQLLILAGILCFSSVLSLAGDDLNPKLIEKIRSDFEMDPQTRAMYNAVTGTDLKTLALNRDLLRNHNEFFSNKVKVKNVTNQKSSGRCWMFAALNSIRHEVIKKNSMKDFHFSHIYLAFWDKMEKANTFYEKIIEFRDRDMMDREQVFMLRTPLPDGGYWENAKDLIQKYGVVPKEVMPETNSSEKTAGMNKVMERKMRVDAVKLRKMAAGGKSVSKMRKAKEKMLAEIYGMLVMNMGAPPEKFDWRYEPKKDKDDNEDDDNDEDKDDDEDDEDETYKDNSIIITGYTPKRFYDEFVGVDLDQYVDLFNDAIRPVLKRYSVGLTRNLADGHDLNYVNIDIETLKSIAVKSLLDDTPLWFSVDVGVDQDRTRGMMANDLYDYGAIFGVDMKMTKAELSLFRQNAPTHAMNLIGVDLQDGKPVKWLVENSWGEKNGSKGFWTMYNDWFELNVFGLVVKKQYVPEKILKILEQEPTKLPAWDPMW